VGSYVYRIHRWIRHAFDADDNCDDWGERKAVESTDKTVDYNVEKNRDRNDETGALRRCLLAT
jgi:hypothetical protein